jgi:allantoate deiminase
MTRSKGAGAGVATQGGTSLTKNAVGAEAPSRGRPDAARIGSTLAEISRIGVDPDGGISRISFTNAERAAHDLVGGWLRDLGLSVWVDGIGNTLAERPGTQADAPAIGVGSHLDSVPHGGRFDGIVGIVGALELARLFRDDEIITRHPLRIVMFAGKEGARFGEPCIGSKAVAGQLADRDLSSMHDATGISIADALRSIGFDPRGVAAARWRPAEWAAFLELHIEQARMLELTGAAIGLVDMVSGSTRLRVELSGRADHSGGTPMEVRADALAAAAEAVLAAEALAKTSPETTAPG